MDKNKFHKAPDYFKELWDKSIEPVEEAKLRWTGIADCLEMKDDKLQVEKNQFADRIVEYFHSRPKIEAGKFQSCLTVMIAYRELAWALLRKREEWATIKIQLSYHADTGMIETKRPLTSALNDLIDSFKKTANDFE